MLSYGLCFIEGVVRRIPNCNRRRAIHVLKLLNNIFIKYISSCWLSHSVFSTTIRTNDVQINKPTTPTAAPSTNNDDIFGLYIGRLFIGLILFVLKYHSCILTVPAILEDKTTRTYGYIYVCVKTRILVKTTLVLGLRFRLLNEQVTTRALVLYFT